MSTRFGSRHGSVVFTLAAAALPLGVCLVSACGASKPPPPPVATEAITPSATTATTATPANDVPPEEAAKQQRLIARMLKKVSAVRGIEAKKEVPGRTLAREKLLARVKEHVAKEIPASAIRNEGLVLQLFGLVPMSFDYETETFALLEAQLAGYYEPADHTMYMAADLDEENAKATLAHELVHALQDQGWDLATRSKYKPGHGDEASARSALAEGDATSAMLDVLIGDSGHTALDMPEEIFSSTIAQSMDKGPGSNAPRVMRASLLAPYLDGTLFVHGLRRKGGWEAVNQAWQKPPVTSEQILHLDKYFAHEPAIEITAPAFTSLGAGWSQRDTDVYGELGARLTFAEWVDGGKAAAVAANWGGDRGILLQKGKNEFAFAWRVRYDAAPKKAASAYADRAYATLLPAIEAKVAPNKLPGKKGAAPMACIPRQGLGPLGVTHKGRDLIFVVGPTEVTGPVAGGSKDAPSKEASDCTVVQKWLTELAAVAP